MTNLFYFDSTSADNENVHLEPRSVLLERQARKSGLAVSSTIVKAATDLLLRAQGSQGMIIS